MCTVSVITEPGRQAVCWGNVGSVATWDPLQQSGSMPACVPERTVLEFFAKPVSQFWQCHVLQRGVSYYLFRRCGLAVSC